MVFGGKDFKVQTLVFPSVKIPKENPKVVSNQEHRAKVKKGIGGEGGEKPH
jgi:hypothetical protein